MRVSNNEKELITWSNRLMCGIKLIDDQHKGLVDLVNEMFLHVTGNEEQEREYFTKITQEAVNYAKIHFATEEGIMRATNFTGYAQHKKEHDRFVLSIIENINEYDTVKRHYLMTFTRFLRDWVLSHIALMDVQYFEHLKKNASRCVDGKVNVNINEAISA